MTKKGTQGLAYDFFDFFLTSLTDHSCIAMLVPHAENMVCRVRGPQTNNLGLA
jgi:hypothetical protein